MVVQAVRSTAGKAKESVRYNTARRGRSVAREAEDPNKPGAGEQQTTGSSVGPTEKLFAYGLPGSTLPIRNFDPLGFSNADKLEVMRFREAEVTHGRVAMLAVLGFLAGENLQVFFPNQITSNLAINQWQQTPRPFEGILVTFIGVAEAIRARIGWEEPTPGNFFKLRNNYSPGNLKFDPLNLYPDDNGSRRDLEAKELNNGRLAMIAIVGFVVQEVKQQRPILEQFNTIQNPFVRHTSSSKD